jgi:predicted ribosomally synthesized six-cysteine peptide SCIFF
MHFFMIELQGKYNFIQTEGFTMKRIQTVETKNIAKTVENGGCGECQTSCQSACKTSCGVANQQCENNK